MGKEKRGRNERGTRANDKKKERERKKERKRKKMTKQRRRLRGNGGMGKRVGRK